MIEISRSLIVNDGTRPELSVGDVWTGLQEKAANPMPYVKSITSCTVIDQFEGGLIRDISHVGQPVREVVTFYPKRRVHFVRTHGSERDTIDNEIGHDERSLSRSSPIYHRRDDGLIDDYRVFFDLAPVFA